MLQLLTLGFVLSGWAIAAAGFFILPRRRRVPEAWAWLAIMFALPWVGPAAYLAMAENPLGRRRVVQYRQVIANLKSPRTVKAVSEHTAVSTLDESAAAIERVAEAGGALSALGGNDAVFITDSQRIVEGLVRDIDQAQRHVNLDFYIFLDDGVGRRIAEALTRAASRGVCCRVLADALGSRRFFTTLGRRLREGGVDVRAAKPINPLLGRQLARIDVRNHRKIAVIDDKVGYIGSWNVADPGFRPKVVGGYHDLMVRLCGPAALQLQLMFFEDWQVEKGESLEAEGYFVPPGPQGPHVIQALPSGPMYPSTPIRDITVAALNQARRRFILTTPYFIPDETIVLAFRLAAQRGVRVDVIVPHRSDMPVVDQAGRSYFGELMEAGVNVHLYQPGLLHAKTLTADEGVAMIGSANFDTRSFRLDVEANLLLYSRPLVAALRSIQERYLADSTPVEEEAWACRPWRTRMGEHLAKLLSPLL